jgi:hypothetical protein
LERICRPWRVNPAGRGFTSCGALLLMAVSVTSRPYVLQSTCFPSTFTVGACDVVSPCAINIPEESMLSQTAGQTSLESRCLFCVADICGSLGWFRLSAVLYAIPFGAANLADRRSPGAAVRSGKESGMKPMLQGYGKLTVRNQSTVARSLACRRRSESAGLSRATTDATKPL